MNEVYSQFALNSLSALGSLASVAALLAGGRRPEQDALRSLRGSMSRSLRVRPEDINSILDTLQSATTREEIADTAISAIAKYPSMSWVTSATIDHSQLLRSILAAIERVETALCVSSLPDLDRVRSFALTLACEKQRRTLWPGLMKEVPLERIHVAQTIVDPLSGEEFFSNHRFVEHGSEPFIICGPYGYGKSTTLRLIDVGGSVDVVARPVDSDMPTVSLLVRAGDLLASPEKGIWNQLDHCTFEQYALRLLPLVEKHLGEFYLRVMVDGLDEVNDLRGIDALTESLIQFAHRLGDKGHVMLGGRPAAFARESMTRIITGRARLLEIQGFSAPQRLEWIEKWECVARDADIECSIEHFEAREDPYEIYSTPLILLLRALVTDSTSAKTRASLFCTIVDFTVGGKAWIPREMSKAINGYVDAAAGRPESPGNDRQKRRMLQEAAHWAVRSSSPRVSAPELRRHFSADSFKIDLQKLEEEDQITEPELDTETVMRSFSLAHFFDQGPGHIEFIHFSFAEFLAAELLSVYPTVLPLADDLRNRPTATPVESFLTELIPGSAPAAEWLCEFMLDRIGTLDTEDACKYLTALVSSVRPEDLSRYLGMARPAFSDDLAADRVPKRASEAVSRGLRAQGASRLRGAELNSASSWLTLLTGCSLEGVTFLQWASSNASYLENPGDFSQAEASHPDLALAHCNLASSRFRLCEFAPLELDCVRFTGELGDGNFSDCKIILTGREAVFERISFQGCTIHFARQASGERSSIVFEECSFSSCTFSGRDNLDNGAFSGSSGVEGLWTDQDEYES